MDIAFLFIILLAVKAASLRKNTDPDYMAPGEITGIKGIFVLLVILSHFSAYYVPALSDTYKVFKSHLGQCVVVMFLFYSGYGMMEQMKKRGFGYVQTVPRRFLTLLINFDIAVVLYGLLQWYLGKTFSASSYLLSLTGWDSLGNSNWYIFCVLCLYVLTFLCFQPLRREGKASLYMAMGFMAAATVLLVVVLRAAGKESWWYNTALTFPLGMLFSLMRPVADKLIKSKFVYLLACAGVAVVYTLSSVRRGLNLGYYTLWTFMFAAAVVLVSVKVRLRSPLLDYAGKHVFSLYILQRLPMMWLKQAGLLTTHPYMSLLIAVAVTVLLAEVFDHLTGKLQRKLWGK